MPGMHSVNISGFILYPSGIYSDDMLRLEAYSSGIQNQYMRNKPPKIPQAELSTSNSDVLAPVVPLFTKQKPKLGDPSLIPTTRSATVMEILTYQSVPKKCVKQTSERALKREIAKRNRAAAGKKLRKKVISGVKIFFKGVKKVGKKVGKMIVLGSRNDLTNLDVM